MSHAHRADRPQIKPAAGARPASAAHTQTDHSKGTPKAAGPLTSHMRHDNNQPRDGPRQTDPPSLTVP